MVIGRRNDHAIPAPGFRCATMLSLYVSLGETL